MTFRLRLVVGLMSVVFFAAHVRTLPRTLEDLDSINFALGVEQFDVSRHRPHPPGYPVFIALAKASTAAVRAVLPTLDRDRAAADGLAFWGLAAGTAAPFVLAEFWLAVGLTSTAAVLASLLAVASPLFWFTAARPLTDAPGLVAALAIQTLLIRGLRRPRDDQSTALPSEWLWGALGAGLIIGLRSQTMWLTGPVLCWCVSEAVRSGRAKDAALLVGAAAVGALIWAVPLVLLSGGPAAYFRVLLSQGGADFRGVEMLATTPTLRLLRIALARTFVWPWVVPALAYAVLLLAIAGAVRLAANVTGRRVLAAVVLSCSPYLAFHLMFQETLTLRYALPLVVPIAGLAVAALSTFGTRAAAALTAGLVAVCLVIVQPRLEAYSKDGDPFFRSFEQMVRALPDHAPSPVLRMHHQVWWAARRVMEWYQPIWDVGPQPHPGDREWLRLVQEWTAGSTRPTWYLTDVTRSDVALFNPRSRTFRGRYDVQPAVRALLTPGLAPRLDQYNWWEIRRPGWMLGRGWALTPEIAGMTAADAAAGQRPDAEAFVLRPAFADRGRGLRILVGGRYLASKGQPAALVSAVLDGRPVAQWRVASEPAWFAQWIEMPGGVPDASDSYARLVLHVASENPAQPPPAVGLEEFDAAPFDQPVTAFADGWQEPEASPQTGSLWRWTSQRSVLEIRGGIGDLMLTLSGESPLKFFAKAPDVVVSAGGQSLARFQPADRFSRQIELPAAALAASQGRVTIETSLTFSPADRGQSQDHRVLGLQLTKIEVSSARGK